MVTWLPPLLSLVTMTDLVSTLGAGEVGLASPPTTHFSMLVSGLAHRGWDAEIVCHTLADSGGDTSPAFTRGLQTHTSSGLLRSATQQLSQEAASLVSQKLHMHKHYPSLSLLHEARRPSAPFMAPETR